ncbi:MAG: GntR family transcriptional regulator [Candidatus Eremiobacteraeota bacterium]|nr:GntR family transcriptional regulator [Candidatus Eremiobacteraeota bacterium]
MKQAFVAVDPNLDAPPYVQIEQQLKGVIERGELRPGDALPTVRQLAGDLNVAPNTVARAYADLQDEGWLVSEGRRGTRVATRLPTGERRARSTALRKTIGDFVGDLLARGYSRHEIDESVQAALRQA